MSERNINIKISGGNNDFGNIIQGNNNQITFSREKALEDFNIKLSKLQEDQKISTDEVENLKMELKKIIHNIENDNISNKIEMLYKKYSWAFEPLKKLFDIILP